MKGLADVLLKRVLRGPSGPGLLVPLSPVKVHIVWLHGCDIRRVFLQVLVVVEGLCDLVVGCLADFLCTYVIYELGGRFNTHFRLYLTDESVGINLALVEALENIIQLGCGFVCELERVRID